MNAIVLTVFVSALLFAWGLLQFAVGWHRKDHQHADRLALLPLQDDDVASVASTTSVSPASAESATKDPRHER